MREFSLRGNVVVTYERFASRALRSCCSARRPESTCKGRARWSFVLVRIPPVAVGFEGGLVAPPADLICADRNCWSAASPCSLFRGSGCGPRRDSVFFRRASCGAAKRGCCSATECTFPGAMATSSTSSDVTAAGYLKGGVELSARLRTPRSTARARWDHLGSDLLAIDGQGAYPQGERSVLAWDVDAIRGARARSGAPTLDEAARATNRAAGEVGCGWAKGRGWGSVCARSGRVAASVRASASPGGHA